MTSTATEYQIGEELHALPSARRSKVPRLARSERLIGIAATTPRMGYQAYQRVDAPTRWPIARSLDHETVRASTTPRTRTRLHTPRPARTPRTARAAGPAQGGHAPLPKPRTPD